MATLRRKYGKGGGATDYGASRFTLTRDMYRDPEGNARWLHNHQLAASRTNIREPPRALPPRALPAAAPTAIVAQTPPAVKEQVAKKEGYSSWGQFVLKAGVTVAGAVLAAALHAAAQSPHHFGKGLGRRRPHHRRR